MGKGEGFLSGYPKRVILILANEFCERFSYYGMKVILVLYLTWALEYSDSTAVAIYHAFSAVTYFTPLFGAMIADGWLGKYRTILYVSMIYGLGNIAMSITAIPFGGEYLSWGVFIGLVLIAIGAGGIKPCVSAFGGDQFKPDQERQKNSFFSLFYMFINIGSLLTTLITPYIRSHVFCFDDSCWTLAFGIPACLMVVSIILFAIGSPFYTKNPPGESILRKIFGCVWTALKGKLKCGKSEEEKKDHWLDYAEDKYDKQLIADIKDVMGVLWLFLPLPFFWALYDQQVLEAHPVPDMPFVILISPSHLQPLTNTAYVSKQIIVKNYSLGRQEGSRWTLQATQMNGDFGSFVMQPDMMGIMNSLMVVVMAPLLESLVFPCLNRFHIPNTPIQRMSLGMALGATAFLMAGLLQIGIDDAATPKPEAGQAKVFFINSAPCPVAIHEANSPEFHANLTSLESMPYSFEAGNTTFDATWGPDCPAGYPTTSSFSSWLNGSTVYEFFLTGVVPNVDPVIVKEQEKQEQTSSYSSEFRFFNSLRYPVNITLHATKSESKDKRLEYVESYGFSDYAKLVVAKYEIRLNNSNIDGGAQFTLSTRLTSKNGPVYTVILSDWSNATNISNAINVTVIEELGPWTQNIFLQVPQYVVLTLAECLFSITGLAFAYSQAPMSMKSLLTAAWLLTVAFGNIIIIIIDETAGDGTDESTIFFIFSGVLYVVTVIFAIMGFFYKYVEPRVLSDSESGSTTGSDEKPAGEIKIAVFGSDDVTSDEKPPLPTYDEIKQDEDGTGKEKEIELAESLEKKLEEDGYTNVALDDDDDSDSVKF